MSNIRVPFQLELDAAVEAALAGGNVVAHYYANANAATYQKGDGSPVTDADLAADNEIRAVLTQRFPDIPLLTEEGLDDAARLASERCWIVDPIDGTEQFIQRTGEFDVLVALVEHGRPIVSVGYQPTTRTLVMATRGGGAWVRRGDANPVPFHIAEIDRPPLLATSKWFGAPGNAEILTSISDRLQAGHVPPLVTGFTPRMFLDPRLIDALIGIRDHGEQVMAHEWDFAVADLVIAESGGMVTDLHGNIFLYNQAVPLVTGGVIATVDPAMHARILNAMSVEMAERGIMP